MHTRGLTSFQLILIVLRLIAFCTCWFAGCDFWFLPTLFDEDVSLTQTKWHTHAHKTHQLTHDRQAGFIDSFIPLYSFEKRQDDMLMIGARIFAAFLAVGRCGCLPRFHSWVSLFRVLL